jgi:hypothetical protein
MPEHDPVRDSSPSSANTEIDQETLAQLRHYAEYPEAIDQRLAELREEWDTERMLAANASTLMLISLGLSRATNRWWLILATIVPAFLLQHALQGWCPPIEVFRRMGMRSRQEIDREVYALKALRGDFEDARSGDAAFAAANVE